MQTITGTELTEQSTIKDLFEIIEISSVVRRRLDKHFKGETTLGNILGTAGDVMHKKITSLSYIDICELLLHAGFHGEQHALFSDYIPTAILNLQNGDADKFSQYVSVPDDIQEHITDAMLFPLLRNLRALKALYYYADQEQSDIKKSVLIEVAQKMKKELHIK